MKLNLPMISKALMVVTLSLTTVSVPYAYAGAPSAVAKSQSAATILVTVPTGGKPVTYVLGDKIWTVKPGQTVVLPAGATKISLPAGTILTASVPSAKSLTPTKHVYTVSQPITLSALTPASIKDNAPFITPGSGPSGNGIQLPSGTITDLIDAVSSASGTTINPFNVLGEEVTDGNQS